MRSRCRMRSASSSEVPTGVVISRSRVMTSRIGRLSSVSNCRSRLVMIPASRPSSSTIGTPLIENCCISRSASPSVPCAAQRDRVQDHPALAALHPVHFRRLLVNGHVLVDDADPALPRDRHRHLRFRHRVHRGGQQRDRERQRVGELRVQPGLARMLPRSTRVSAGRRRRSAPRPRPANRRPSGEAARRISSRCDSRGVPLLMTSISRMRKTRRHWRACAPGLRVRSASMYVLGLTMVER